MLFLYIFLISIAIWGLKKYIKKIAVTHYKRESKKSVDAAMKIAEKLAFEKMTDDERAYCTNAPTEKEYYKRFLEVAENHKAIIYDTFSDISKYVEKNALKNRDKYNKQVKLFEKMKKIMPLAQVQFYLDIPFSDVRWYKIIEYIACIDNTEKFSEDSLEVIIELLRQHPAGKKTNEGFYFLIKNMLRSLSIEERKYCMSALTISNFIKRVFVQRSGNLVVFQNSIIECFYSMLEKFSLIINFIPSDRIVVLLILEQIEQQGISPQADGLGGAWTVLQDEKTVRLIAQKLNQLKF